MTIKQYAFHLHGHLRAQAFASLTRSQVHELLAAAAGFATHAAFLHQAVWCDVDWRDTGLTPHKDRIIQRCLDFGMSPDEAERTAQGLTSFLDTSGYAPIRFEELIDALASEEDDWLDTDKPGSAVVARWVSTDLVHRMSQGFDG